MKHFVIFFVQYNAVCGEVLAAAPTVAEGFHFKLTYPPSHAGILFAFFNKVLETVLREFGPY